MDVLLEKIISFENSLKCPACKNTLFLPATVSECGHHFCLSCIDSHIGKFRSCPECHIPAISGNIFRNNSLDEIALNLAKFKECTPLDFPPPVKEPQQTRAKEFSEASLAKLIFPPTQESTNSKEISDSAIQKEVRMEPTENTFEEPPTSVSKAPQKKTPRAKAFVKKALSKNLKPAQQEVAKKTEASVAAMPSPNQKGTRQLPRGSRTTPNNPSEIIGSGCLQQTEVKTDSRKKWSCTRCTFMNLTRAKKCSMCFSPREQNPLKLIEEKTPKCALITSNIPTEEASKRKPRPNKAILKPETSKDEAPKKNQKPSKAILKPETSNDEVPKKKQKPSKAISKPGAAQDEAPRKKQKPSKAISKPGVAQDDIPKSYGIDKPIMPETAVTKSPVSLPNHVIEPVTPSRSARKNEQVLVIFTGFFPHQKKLIAQCVKNLNHKGLKIREIEKESDFHKATHLVTCLKPNVSKEANVCSRTIKYLLGLIYNIPVIKQAWLEDSLNLGNWKNTDGYLLNGSASYGPLDTLLAPSHDITTRALFLGYTFYFKGFSDKTVPTRSELQGLVKAAGGKVISNLPLVKEQSDQEIQKDLDSNSFTMKISALGRRYMILEAPNKTTSNGSKGRSDETQHYRYSICHFPSDESLKNENNKRIRNDSGEASSVALKMPLPSKSFPLVITMDKSGSEKIKENISDEFPPANENLYDQSTPHSWILDCINGRSVLPLPYSMKE